MILPFRRVGTFGDRAIDSFEQNVSAFTRGLLAGVMQRLTPSDSRVKISAIAEHWSILRYDPSAGGIVLLLPPPDDDGAGVIALKNDTTSATAVTVRCVRSDCTVDNAATLSVSGSRVSAVFHPDGARKNWIKL